MTAAASSTQALQHRLDSIARSIIADPYRMFIVATLTGCTTGTDRLPAPLAGTGAVIAHKTGTGDTDSRGRIIGLNDAGTVTLPDGRRYSIAVLIKDSAASPSETASVIAAVSEAVYRHMTAVN